MLGTQTVFCFGFDILFRFLRFGLCGLFVVTVSDDDISGQRVAVGSGVGSGEKSLRFSGRPSIIVIIIICSDSSPVASKLRYLRINGLI